MSLKYVISEGFAGIKRARLAAFTSIFSLFIAILLLGILSRVAFNAYEIAQSLRSNIDVEVFIMDVDERTRQQIRYKLETNPIVNDLDYISKDSAAAIFRKQFGAESSTFSSMDFLPASFRVKIKDGMGASRIQKMVEEVQNYRGVEDVKFNQQLLQLLEKRYKYLMIIGIGIGAIILLAALALVFNTIRLTIYAKENLIKSMKLVGATDKFIRRPFLVEGIIHGLISGTAAVGVVYLVFHHLLPKMLPQIEILEWPYGKWYYLGGAMVLLAVLMGIIGSSWAARKFIKRTSIAD